MSIKGINHITFSVSDLERSFDFYKEVLELTPKLRWDEGAYFLVGDLWLCLSMDRKTRNGASEEYTHTAFDIDVSSFQLLSEKIRKSGVEIYKDNKSEGESLYFLDPDGHKLEIHVGSLESRLKKYRNETSERFIFFD